MSIWLTKGQVAWEIPPGRIARLYLRQASELREPPAYQQPLALTDDGPVTPRLLDTERVRRVPGIFTAFIPHRIVQMVWESQLKGEEGERFKESLLKRGITPVAVPDGDKDHASNGGDDD